MKEQMSQKFEDHFFEGRFGAKRLDVNKKFEDSLHKNMLFSEIRQGTEIMARRHERANVTKV